MEKDYNVKEKKEYNLKRKNIMGTLVNGIKEIFATSQSTATHLPVCASDGTPQGRISVGDLASVLGVLKKAKTVSSINYDDLDSGTYYCTLNCTNSPDNTSYVWVIVLKSSGVNSDASQIAWNLNNIWVRRKSGTWGSWLKYNAVADFYKNYSTLAALKTALGVNAICRCYEIAGDGNVNFDTKISINQGNGSLTALAIISTNTGAGTATKSEIGMYQFYYNGNNAPAFTHLFGSENILLSYNLVTDNNTLAFVKKDGSQVYVTLIFSKIQS